MKYAERKTLQCILPFTHNLNSKRHVYSVTIVIKKGFESANKLYRF